MKARRTLAVNFYEPIYMPKAIEVVQKLFPKVRKVVDADESLHVKVTRRDDKKGALGRHDSCALAVACKRQYRCDGVIVGIHVAYLVYGETAERFVLPESVSREVVSFDRKGRFHPGEYQLSKVPRSLKLGKKQKRYQRRSEEYLVHKTAGVRVVLGQQ
jgi:hypothetical protein